MGKLDIARSVWIPHKAVAETDNSPSESRSLRSPAMSHHRYVVPSHIHIALLLPQHAQQPRGNIASPLVHAGNLFLYQLLANLACLR